MASIEFIQPSWPVNKRVFCASTTTIGGVSTNAFESLNLGSHVGDELHRVEMNRQRLANELKGFVPQMKPISWLNQTHSTNVVSLLEATEPGVVEADAAFTTITDLPCSVMTADCMALMIANTNGTEVAAVHAGWKGLLNGVIENTVEHFSSQRSHIHVWFAPAICQQHFEIGEDLKTLFSKFPSALKASTAKDKALLNLLEVANLKLDALGIFQRYYSNICTYSSTNLFSHRHSTHQGLSACGRMANLILIK